MQHMLKNIVCFKCFTLHIERNRTIFGFFVALMLMLPLLLNWTTNSLSVPTVSDSCLAGAHLVLALKLDQQSECCLSFLLLCNSVRHTSIYTVETNIYTHVQHTVGADSHRLRLF